MFFGSHVHSFRCGDSCPEEFFPGDLIRINENISLYSVLGDYNSINYQNVSNKGALGIALTSCHHWLLKEPGATRQFVMIVASDGKNYNVGWTRKFYVDRVVYV